MRVAGFKGRLTGSEERAARPAGRTIRPLGCITGPSGRTTGPWGHITGPSGRITKLMGRITGPSGHIAGPMGRVTGPAGRIMRWRSVVLHGAVARPANGTLCCRSAASCLIPARSRCIGCCERGAGSSRRLAGFDDRPIYRPPAGRQRRARRRRSGRRRTWRSAGRSCRPLCRGCSAVPLPHSGGALW
jgi:hypothetical protein